MPTARTSSLGELLARLGVNPAARSLVASAVKWLAVVVAGVSVGGLAVGVLVARSVVFVPEGFDSARAVADRASVAPAPGAPALQGAAGRNTKE